MKKRNDGIAEEGELFATHIGGSALPEGVMMRGKLSWAAAVREPSGRIYVEEHELAPADARPAWQRLPTIRGCVSFVESMVLSYKAMCVASDHAYDEEGETYASLLASGRVQRSAASGDAAENGDVPAAAVGEDAGVAAGAGEPAEPESMSAAAFGLSMALGLVLGVVLFMAIPVGVANLLVGDYAPANAMQWNLVEALLRIAIFVAYIWAVGLVPDMRRVFGYHGAEHLTIHCFEHGLPLTPENASRFSRLHVRCGTAFLIMTMIVAILVNTLVPVASWADALGIVGLGRAAFVLVSRLVLLPLVAGVSYEVTVKWAGSHPDLWLVKLVLWPGLQMQRLTTRVPEHDMLECAIAAMQRVYATEQAAGLE